MNFDEYKNFVSQLLPDDFSHITKDQTSEYKLGLLWCVTGLSTEANEVEDIVRKATFMSDRSVPTVVITALLDELSDALFYLVACMIKLGFPLEQVMTWNKEKLLSRMPDGHFSKEEHWNRFIKKLEEKYNEQK